jgi:hypothetical protein
MSKFQNGHKVPLRSQLKSYALPFNKDNVQQKLDFLVQRHQKNNSLGFNKERANNTKWCELHVQTSS